MARHLFIAQQTLATWMDQDKILFDGLIMTIKADGRKFKLVEAVRFIRVEGGDPDRNDLLGKVKTNEQLTCLDAERYRDSVIVGDLAYKVQEGFIGEVFLNQIDQEAAGACAPQPEPGQQASKQAKRELSVAQTQPVLPKVPTEPPSLPSSPAAPPEPARIPRVQPAEDAGAPAKPGKGEDLSDEELLTKFLLDNL